MSIHFSNFALEKVITFSPTATRQSGHYMLYAEFHIFDECDRYAFANNLRTVLREYVQKDYQITTHGTQVVMTIGNLYSYAIGFPLITSIEEMRVKHQISGYLASLEYRS